MISELFSQNLDSWQLLTKELDGGDTCSRHFTALYCLPHSPLEAQHALNLLQVAGIPIRHPDQTKWYCSTNRTSRDQLIPYLCYVASNNREYFQQLVAQHAKNLFLFTWNTRRNHVYETLEAHQRLSTPDVEWNYSWKLPDFCGPNIWSAYIRGFIKHFLAGKLLLPVLYPLLHVLDVYELLDSVYIALQALAGRKPGPTYKPNVIDHDMQNNTLSSHFAATHTPTALSLLAWALKRNICMQAAESFFQQPGEPRLDIAIKTLQH